MEEFKKLQDIIADVLNVDPDEITEETTFTDDLGADSLDLFQVIMSIEKVFKITVPTEEIQNVKTVGEAAKLIQEARVGK